MWCYPGVTVTVLQDSLSWGDRRACVTLLLSVFMPFLLWVGNREMLTTASIRVCHTGALLCVWLSRALNLRLWLGIIRSGGMWFYWSVSMNKVSRSMQFWDQQILWALFAPHLCLQTKNNFWDGFQPPGEQINCSNKCVFPSVAKLQPVWWQGRSLYPWQL